MEHGQGEFIGDSGGIETTSASSGNHNGQLLDYAADGISTDGEHLILGQYDDAAVWPSERYFRHVRYHVGAANISHRIQRKICTLSCVCLGGAPS